MLDVVLDEPSQRLEALSVADDAESSADASAGASSSKASAPAVTTGAWTAAEVEALQIGAPRFV